MAHPLHGVTALTAGDVVEHLLAAIVHDERRIRRTSG